ncbi:transporter substrate-binding domain-containing protein [bacterium]|nr:transporter substrate-binding domain-containing protein [bacterium]
MVKSFLRLIVAFACASLLLFSPLEGIAANSPLEGISANDFVDAIQERGYLKVGLPPYNTPPAYFLEENSDELQGYDVDFARTLASKLGVDIQFDRSSTSFNNLVERVGIGDFDIAIGKLGLTYNRLFDAFPIQYLSFRHAFLANREFVASLGVEPDDPRFGEILKNSTIRIGSIKNSTWETEAKANFPNATFVGYKNWPAAKKALFQKDSVIDAIYRDTTEIKPIVYLQPDLSLEYVPILFDELIDRKSIYLSQDGRLGLKDFIDMTLRREWGGIKTDTNILDEFQSFYLPS